MRGVPLRCPYHYTHKKNKFISNISCLQTYYTKEEDNDKNRESFNKRLVSQNMPTFMWISFCTFILKIYLGFGFFFLRWGMLVFCENVIDMGRREAETILKERGLKVQTYLLEGIDESLARYVFKQSIPKGSFVPIGTLIEIEMSEVKQGTPVNVPKVVGMEQNEATSLLNKLGLEFQVWWTEENNISSEYYYVIDQSISADTSVPAGTKLRLEISPVQP